MPATVRRCRAARPSPSPRSTTPKSSSSTRNNNPPSRTREGKSHQQRSHPNDQGSRSLLFVLRPYRADGRRGCRGRARRRRRGGYRSEEHTSELQSLMRTSYAVFCLKKQITTTRTTTEVTADCPHQW